MKSKKAACRLAAAHLCALVCVLGTHLAILDSRVSAGETEPLSPAVAFRFGGGEKIKLIVVPESVGASIEQLVSDDGYIALPTGGEPLNIRNKSIFEAQKLAAARIGRDSGVLKASAAIALLSVPARSVYIGGEGVKLSQSITLSGSAPLTLYAAILSAGGVGPDSDPTHVSVSHTNPDGSVKTEIFDISSFGDPGTRSSGALGPVLEAGDVVKVPKGEVYVLSGEVLKPGPVTRRELSLHADQSPRVSSLIYATGGLKPGASRKAVRILRNSKDGKRQVLTVDLDAAQKSETKMTGGTSESGTTGTTGVTDPDPLLKDGDIVLVATTGFIPVLGKVRVPGMYPIGAQSIKLSRAIATAGGFAEFAKTSSVVVLKANSTTLHVDMSLLQKGSLQDVDLEEGDLVYVPERLL